MSNLVELSNVTFAYTENKRILNNISMSIPSGKITAIMGGSGSGKTTILRLISGQIQAQSGTVKVFGHDLNQTNKQTLSQIRKQMGLLFQFGALFTDVSVFDNVAFPLIEHTKLPASIINKVVAMKLESIGLTGTQDLMPSELSGGMARRVALARAMVMDPEVMMYDEPFTGLDPISLSTIAMLIKKISKSLEQTSILVTHDIATTMEIADYIYFMAQGEIIASGTPEEIQTTNNPAVKQFIRGEVDGVFNYRYQSSHNYNQYLGI